MRLCIVFITSFLTGVHFQDCARRAKLYKRKPTSNNKFISIDQHPFIVGLLKTFEFALQFRCAAVIIHKKWAITTARCMASDEPSLIYRYWRVRGNTSRYEGYTDAYSDHRISSVYIHHNYVGENNSYDYDVALIKVHQLFIGLHEKPICFATGFYKYMNNSSLTLLIWKEKNINTYTSAKGELESFDVQLYNFQQCRKLYRSFGFAIPSRKLCALRLSNTECTSGWGGPLIRRGILIGLSSMGLECSADHIPWTYTKLSEFNEWILTTVYDLTIVETK
ncbi:hypothetical protein ILUMI_19098 [Ignelater luminosus]|uniref:Peptidase S1 domain-containing protein n=1 Tax=Ignelater luminosus TaxID=2038154 RepID=A0A8K0CGX6_IGNLU|nr:hypothetical protein ILUMI_19098 [Ignelater luminosus]